MCDCGARIDESHNETLKEKTALVKKKKKKKLGSDVNWRVLKCLLDMKVVFEGGLGVLLVRLEGWGFDASGRVACCSVPRLKKK